MFKQISVVFAGLVAVTAFAADGDKVTRSIELKDGSTVHVFQDGKMAMENPNGQVVRMQAGSAMDTKSGERIVMVGDEVARLSSALRADTRGGK